MVTTRKRPLVAEVVVTKPVRTPSREPRRGRSTNNNNNPHERAAVPSASRATPARRGSDSDDDSDAEVADLLLTPHRTATQQSSYGQGLSHRTGQRRERDESDESPRPITRAQKQPRTDELEGQDDGSRQMDLDRDGSDAVDAQDEGTSAEGLNEERGRVEHGEGQGDRVEDDDSAEVRAEESRENHDDAEEASQASQGETGVRPTVRPKPKPVVKPRRNGKGKRGEQAGPLFNEQEEEDADVEDQASIDDQDDQGNETDYDEPGPTAGAELSTRKKQGKLGNSTQGKGKGNAVADDESYRASEDSNDDEVDEEDPRSSARKGRKERSTQVRTPAQSSGQKPQVKKRGRPQNNFNPNTGSTDEEPDPEEEDENADQTHNHWQPHEDPDRCTNPDRPHSFMHWYEGEFVPDRIWLHDHAASWRIDDANRERAVSREQVVELVTSNGGTVFGPHLKGISKSNIVVVPDWTSDGYDKIWRKANKCASSSGFSPGRNTSPTRADHEAFGGSGDRVIVNQNWIYESILLQENGRDPSYRCDPLRPEFTPKGAEPAVVFSSTPFEKRRVVQNTRPDAHGQPVPSSDGQVEIVYRVKEEEEQYWMVLARRCESGPRKNRISKVEMFRKMERKFKNKHGRSFDNYSQLYRLFKDKMLTLKKLRRPKPRTVQQKRLLRDMKLFSTDDDEEEEEEPELAPSGNDDDVFAEDADVFAAGEDDEPREENKVERAPNPFLKRKSRSQLEQEAREEARDESRAATPVMDEFEEQRPVEDEELESDSVESDVDLASLAEEYSRAMHEIQGVWWYSNLSLRRTRTALDFLKQARRVPKRDNAQIGRLVARATRTLFSEQQDSLLRDLPRELDSEARRGHPNWQILRDRGWSDRQLDARMSMLEWIDEDSNAVGEGQENGEFRHWYPTMDDP
ncbi:hypothetical protein JCM11491_006916 [Sporobolomyces phaffii]